MRLQLRENMEMRKEFHQMTNTLVPNVESTKINCIVRWQIVVSRYHEVTDRVDDNHWLAVDTIGGNKLSIHGDNRWI